MNNALETTNDRNRPNETRGLVSAVIFIVVLSSILMFIGLGSTKLWDQDEGFFASAATEMYISGDWIVPTFNGDLFSHKPPFMYWMMMLGFQLFGISAFAARFAAACFGVLAAWLTYRLGRKLFDVRVGVCAGLILPTCLMFNIVSRAATPDVFLVFFVTLGLYWFAKFDVASISGQETASGKLSLSNWIVIYGSFALAVLVKGPIGILLPMAVIGLFKLCTTERRVLPKDAVWWHQVREAVRPFGPVNFLKTVWWMRPITAIVMLMLVAGPWYAAVGIKTNGQFLSEFFLTHHFHRFNTSMDNHSGSLLYYPVSILIGMFPWSFFALPIALEWWGQLKHNVQRRRKLIFLGCWVAVIVGLFSCAQTKLSNYVLPAYPPLAILVGLYFSSLLEAVPADRWKRLKVQSGGVTMLMIGSLVLIALPLLVNLEFDGQTLLEKGKVAASVGSEIQWMSLLGIPIIVAGCAVLWCARFVGLQSMQRPMKLKRFNPVFSTTLMLGTVVLILVSAVYAPRVAKFQSPQRLAEQSAQLSVVILLRK